MDFKSVVNEIIARRPEPGFLPKANRVAEILTELDNPDENLALIHVTGTNGKSTTSKMAQEILTQHGVKTGLFTSPHIFEITERLQIDGESISKNDFVLLYESIKPIIENYELMTSDQPKFSFFEILTVMAICYFSAANCDAAVIEVGVGGKFDATNAICPNVSVITNVDFDHAVILGETLEKIVEHKAGIIKPFVQVVVGKSDNDEVEQLIAVKASENDSPLLLEERDLFVLRVENAVGGIVADLEIKGEIFEEVAINLTGAVNAKNALLALQATKIVLNDEYFAIRGIDFDENKAKTALSLIKMPARFETISKEPLVICDIAHNPAAASALKEAMHERENIVAWIGLIAMSDDKDAHGYFEEILDEFVTVFLTQNKNQRSYSSETLSKIASEINDNFSVSKSIQDALNSAITTAKQLEISMRKETGIDMLQVGVLICGSAFNILEANEALK